MHRHRPHLKRNLSNAIVEAVVIEKETRATLEEHICLRIAQGRLQYGLPTRPLLWLWNPQQGIGKLHLPQAYSHLKTSHYGGIVHSAGLAREVLMLNPCYFDNILADW